MSRTGEWACGDGRGDGEERRRQAGFSLLELLAVITLLVLLTATVIRVAWPGRGAVEVKATGEAVAAYIRNARTSAIATGLAVVVIVDAERHLVYRADASAQPLLISPRIAIAASTAEQESEAPGLAGIRFFANGSSTGGKLILKRDRTSYEITVNWLTGRIVARAAA